MKYEPRFTVSGHKRWLVDIATSDLVFVAGTGAFVAACSSICSRFENEQSQLRRGL